MEAKIDFNGETYNVELFKGKPLAVAPKSYKYIGVFGHNVGYNELGYLYQDKSGNFVYAIYRDGCFYPYYGRLIFGELIDVPVLGDKIWFVLAGKEESETNGLTKAEAIKIAKKLRDKNERFYIGRNKYVCGELKYAFYNLDDLYENIQS